MILYPRPRTGVMSKLRTLSSEMTYGEALAAEMKITATEMIEINFLIIVIDYHSPSNGKGKDL